MSDKELVEKIVMFRTELERQNAGMGIMSLFDTICSYYGEQHRTIKSQKEEIKRLSTCQDCGGSGVNELCHDPYYVVPCICTVDWYSENMELRKQIESLKAITELAVKTLKEISDGGSTGEDARDMRTTADFTLSEIERLQNAPT